VSNYLRALGGDVRCHASPAALLNTATRDNSPEIGWIFFDQDSPDAASPDFAEAIAHYRGKGTRVVGIGRSGFRVNRTEMAPEFFLSKPIRIVQLERLFIAPALPSSDAPPKEKALPETRPVLRILVAEDNAINQRLIQLKLQKLGYKSDLAKDGREALDAALQQNYDLILMDWQMPEMDGLEVTRRIRASEAERAVQRPVCIAALTAHAFEQDRAEALSAGCDDFLTKPADLGDLAAVIGRAAKR
jgi:CheY-like chemotaxis protein